MNEIVTPQKGTPMIKVASLLFVVTAGALGGALAADPTPSTAPSTERGWNIQLEGFCHHPRKGAAPLFIYAREADGQWLATMVSSRKMISQSMHSIDLSKVPIKDGKFKGTATMNFVPDNYVPFDHVPYPIVFEFDAISPKPGTLEGTWKVVSFGTKDASTDSYGKEGKLVGTSTPGPAGALPNNITFNMSLPGTLIGGDPTFGERATTLIVACENGKAVGARWATPGMSLAATTQIEGSCERYSLRGKCSFPGSTLDGEEANYIVEFEGSVVADILTGVYKASITIAGKPAVMKQGGFQGTWGEGVNLPAVDARPWWVPVKDFKEVQPGEHPRLLFRKGGLPMLRKRAETAEGKAILARLRQTLDGKNGDSMPVAYYPEVGPVDHDGTGPFTATAPMGSFTIGHVAGYGLLYQVTGEKKYADLARQCFEKSVAGYRDVDCRYSFQGPQNPFRGGTALAWMAVGYDLCYDGWDEATRAKVAKAIAEYKGILNTKGDSVSLEKMVTGGGMPPFSNHYGATVGGAAVGLLAVVNDPGTDQARVKKLLAGSERSMARNMTEGFGDGGFFPEGDGCGSISSQLSFLPALQAWRNVLGRDYVNVERPNARMLTLKWIYLTVVRGGQPDFWPIRGMYGHNVWARGDKSGAGYFCEGIACVTDDQKAAMKWYYDQFLLAGDTKAGGPYDTVSRYPQMGVCAFANWPFETRGRNPAEVLPLCYRDSIRGFYAWRNRWQDENDIVISVLLEPTQGYMRSRSDGGLQIAAFGKKDGWGSLGGATKYWWSSPRGHASVLTVQNGATTGIDFTKASGADALLVTTGLDKGQSADQQVKLGNTTLNFRFLTAEAKKPAVTVEGDKAVIGKQTLTLKDGNICFGVTAP